MPSFSSGLAKDPTMLQWTLPIQLTLVKLNELQDNSLSKNKQTNKNPQNPQNKIQHEPEGRANMDVGNLGVCESIIRYLYKCMKLSNDKT